MIRIRFALWNIGVWLCDRLPGYTCWLHGGERSPSAFGDLPDEAWERWGWNKP